MTDYDISVVGAGLAGQIAAIALARSGRHVALIAPKTARNDQRTTALMDQSIRFLDRLGLWKNIEPSSAALSIMQIIDGTDRLLRAPTVQFRSSEISLPAFGWNIPNKPLNDALEQAIAVEPNITVIEAVADTIELTPEQVVITLDKGPSDTGQTVTSAFVIGADGRKSKVRDAAGIGVRSWGYPQTALVMNFAHTLPHGNVSTEFHTPTGPFTQVPLPGNRSSLVWVVKPEQAAEMLALSTEELSARVEDRMQSMLGKVTVEDGVQSWPLSSMMADRFGKGRVALVGEAGHAFPPIGAQGLNLSLRDIMTLTDLLGASIDKPIAGDAGNAFERRRKVDVMSRTWSVDLLNRSLLSSFLPVQMLRAAGLHLLSGLSPLRSTIMREGIEPGRGLKAIPSLLWAGFKR